MTHKKIYPLYLTLAAVTALYFFSASTSSQNEVGYYPPSKRFVSHKKDSVPITTKKKDTLLMTAEELNNCYVIDSFFKAMTYHQRFNGNVLIAHDGKVLFSG